MASEFLSYDQVKARLSLTREQLDRLIQDGKLRALMDAGQRKFRAADIEAYLAKSAGGQARGKFEFIEEIEQAPIAPRPSQPAEAGGKLDLSDIESAPGADISDQTSVLPAAEAEEPPSGAAEPVFDFSEEEEPSDGILVADESESSADILQVAEEIEGESSSDLSAAPADESSKSSSGSSAAVPGDSDLVADILSPREGESSEEDALETVDLAELDTSAAQQAENLLEGVETLEEETVALDRMEAETQSVGEALLEPETGEEAVEVGAAMAPQRGAPVYTTEIPCRWANIALGVSAFLVLLGGFLMLSETLSGSNPIASTIGGFFKSLGL